MEFEDINDLEQTEQDIASTEKKCADEVARVWYPFGKLCCKFLAHDRDIFGKSIYSRKVKLTDNIVFYSDSVIEDDYLFELYYKGRFRDPKLMLRINIRTVGGLTDRPVEYGFLYTGSARIAGEEGHYCVTDEVFYYDEAYKDYILEAYQIIKQLVSKALSKKLTRADSAKAFGSLTFAEAFLKDFFKKKKKEVPEEEMPPEEVEKWLAYDRDRDEMKFLSLEYGTDISPMDPDEVKVRQAWKVAENDWYEMIDKGYTEDEAYKALTGMYGNKMVDNFIKAGYM